MATHRDKPARYLDGPPGAPNEPVAPRALTRRGRVLGVEPIGRPARRAHHVDGDVPSWLAVLVVSFALVGGALGVGELLARIAGA